MLNDRILALRQANIYEKQSYRHILGLPIIVSNGGGEAECETPFLVVRIMHDGQTDVFATGVYLDTLRAQGNQLKFASRAGGVRFLAHRHADGDSAVISKMAFTISVQGKDIQFPCEPNETLLDAAQRAGYEIPYSCRKGVCGSCKGQIVSGEVRAYAGDALSAAERADRQVLFCQTRPRSDLEIAPKLDREGRSVRAQETEGPRVPHRTRWPTT